MDEYIYVELQTGVIHSELPKSPSNFYRYTFRLELREEVERRIESAFDGGMGTVYTPDDLEWFDRNQIDQTGGLIPHPGNPNAR